MNRKPYFLFDYYEDYGIIDHYDTEEEARAAAAEWNEETDGECDVHLFVWNEKLNGCEDIETLYEKEDEDD